MIIYLIGAPGIGKTTVKRSLINKTRLGNSHLFVDPYRVYCTPYKNCFLSALYPPERYYADFLHRLIHFICYRPPTIEERLDAFSKVERNWQAFLNSWGRCLAAEGSLKMHSVVGQIELLQVRAWLELYCPENACVIMDESLCNRHDFFFNTPEGIANAREYFRTVPCPDALILLDGSADLVFSRLEERRTRQNWVNVRHRGMTADELLRETEWTIELSQICVEELCRRNISYLSVNACDTPESICNQISSYLNEEFRLDEFKG